MVPDCAALPLIRPVTLLQSLQSESLPQSNTHSTPSRHPVSLQHTPSPFLHLPPSLLSVSLSLCLTSSFTVHHSLLCLPAFLFLQSHLLRITTMIMESDVHSLTYWTHWRGLSLFNSPVLMRLKSPFTSLMWCRSTRPLKKDFHC